MAYKILLKCIFILPSILLFISIFNIFFPTDYRNDKYLINGYFSKENIKILNYILEEKRTEILKYEDAINKFDELFSTYGYSLKFLNEATKVYFTAKSPMKYSWQNRYAKVKFQENWILFLIRKFEEVQIFYTQKSRYGGSYIFYQSSDYKFALKRGISICSQDAISFANLLKRRYDIDYNIVGLGEHVVMQAKINNKFYLSDPNMGLTFDFSIEEYYDSYENKIKIKNAYNSIGRSDIIKSYRKNSFRKFEYTGPKALDSTYNPDSLTFYSNYLKWLLPILILFFGIFLRFRRK